METAVTLLLDGQPLMGEQVAVFGQGIVGLLLTGLLARWPLASLVTVDLHSRRRLASETLGAHASLDPSAPGAQEKLLSLLQGPRPYPGADLTYEISGNPTALDQAIAATGFSGRVVIGSWYGQKRADLQLGGRFHRSRMRLISSQVSSIAPELTGRWNKTRRYHLTWQMLQEINPARFITHRFPLTQAPLAYELIDRNPAEVIQVVLTY
jgi:threonine dehydrogenase-like Zn-dependent dehydrogenase